VPPVAREIVTRLLAGATGPINPSAIKEAIVRKAPDFDEREHGFSTFSRLLESLEQEGLLKRQQQGRQWYDGGPEGKPSAGTAAADDGEDEDEDEDPTL
jgi:hypothetical protein